MRACFKALFFFFFLFSTFRSRETEVNRPVVGHGSYYDARIFGGITKNVKFSGEKKKTTTTNKKRATASEPKKSAFFSDAAGQVVRQRRSPGPRSRYRRLLDRFVRTRAGDARVINITISGSRRCCGRRANASAARA